MLAQRADRLAAKGVRPPRETLEHLLVYIWQEVLPVGSWGIDESFFSLGGTPTLAERMLLRVGERCGRTLPLPVFAEAPTIRKLAEALRSQDRPIGPLRYRAFAPPDGHQASATPFFFLHGDFTSGGLYCAGLARRLASRRPVYTLEPPGLDGTVVPSTISEMVASYLETLRLLQPHGPYRLGGYCNGSLAAFEMARRLVAEGERVERLILVSPRLRTHLWAFRRASRGVGRLLGMTPDAERRRFLALVDMAIRQREQWRYRIGRLDYWWRRPLGEQLRRVVARPNRLEGRGRPPAHARTARPLPPDELRRRALIGGMVGATRDCVPGRYPGSVVILWGDEDSGFRRGDPERSWRRLVGHLTVLPIRGDHFSCVTLHLDGLAERLLLCLDAPSNTEAPLDFVASPRS